MPMTPTKKGPGEIIYVIEDEYSELCANSNPTYLSPV